MANPSEQDDLQWLSALAGRPDPAADPIINRQSEAVRKALRSHKTKLESLTPIADDALLQRFLARLRDASKVDEHPSRQSQRTSEQILVRLRFFSQKLRTLGGRPPVWATAASILLGFVLVLQIQRYANPPAYEDVVRGGDVTALLIAEYPEQRLEELLTALPENGPRVAVSRAGNGEIRVEIPYSDALIDFLIEQRIPPPTVNSPIVILIQKEP